MLLADRQVWFTPLMFVLVLAGTSAEGRAQDTAGAGPQDAIRNCMKQDPGAARAACWDDAIRNFLGNGTTKQALALLQGLAKDDPSIRLAGHPIAHAIGRETYRKAGSVHRAFQECDHTQASGCYHGVLERSILPDTKSAHGVHIAFDLLVERAPRVCDEVGQKGGDAHFQCLHGLGHAVLFNVHYDIEKGMKVCDALSTDYERDACGTGLFMENVTAFDPTLRALRPDEPHYPCSVVPKFYQSACYAIHTTWWLEQGFTVARIVEECARAGNTDFCYISLGRDLSSSVSEGIVSEPARVCENLTREYREACIHGATYALTDNTLDGSYAFRFCDAFRGGDGRQSCYYRAILHLRRALATTHDVVEADCVSYSRDPKLCREVARRVDSRADIAIK